MKWRRLYGRNGALLRVIDDDEARNLIVSGQAESKRSGRSSQRLEIHLLEERPLLHFPIGQQPVYREYLEHGRSGQGPWTFRRAWKAQAVTA